MSLNVCNDINNVNNEKVIFITFDINKLRRKCVRVELVTWT